MTTAKMIVGIMKMMAAVMTADETAAMPSHVSLHDSAHHAVSSFVPQSARHSVRAASIAAIVVTYQMMSQSEPMRWQIAPRMHMTIAAVCVQAPLPASFGPQQHSIEPPITAKRPPRAEIAPGAPSANPMSVTMPNPRTQPPMHLAEPTSFATLGLLPHIAKGGELVETRRPSISATDE